MKTYAPSDIDRSELERVMRTFEKYEEPIDAIEKYAGAAVREAYLCEKPLTELELGDRTSRETVEAFARVMDEWFYTYIREKTVTIDGEECTLYSVFLSRFEGVIEAVKQLTNDGTERMPTDIRGILFGYETIDVAGFCDEKTDLLR